MPGLQTQQEKILEALLFSSGEGVPLARLADAISCDVPVTRNLLQRMAETYAAQEAGILLTEADESYRLSTNPAYYEYIQKMLRLPGRRPLSQVLLETLSIIAYKQPVTKAVIEEIRGVNADHAVNRLMEYGLIIEKGRLDAPGKPILFGTSEDFLRAYGLRNVEELTLS